MCGILLVVLGSFADFFALSFAPQSLVSPLGSTTMIANVFFAQCLSNEKATKMDLAATGAVLVGAGLTTYSADHTAKTYTFKDMEELAMETAFLTYVGVTALFVGVLMASVYMEMKRDRNGFSKITAFSYAAMSGIFGAQSVLLAKMVGEVVMESVSDSGMHPLQMPGTYALGIGLICTVLMQTYLQNLGLQSYDALIIFPIFQVFWVVFSVLGGLIYFQEINNLNQQQSVVFTIAISIIILGVYFLAQHEAQQVSVKRKLTFKTAVNTVIIARRMDNFGTAFGKRSVHRAAPSSKPSVSWTWGLLGVETALLSARYNVDTVQDIQMTTIYPSISSDEINNTDIETSNVTAA